MKLRTALLSAVFMFCFVYAQSGEKKFNLSGFADMRLSKFILPENALMGMKSDMKWGVYLSHINIYQEFKPNDHVRILTELSFQDKPINYGSPTTGMIIRTDMSDFYGGGTTETVAVEATPQLRNTAERDFVRYEWGSFSVERAIFSLSLNRYLNLSAGKFITPAGIWNVDHGSPVITTIIQPSQYSTLEIYPAAQTGLIEKGRLYIADAELSYNLYLSSGRQGLTFEHVKDMGTGGQAILRLPVLDECRIGFSGYTGTVRNQLTNAIVHLTEDSTNAIMGRTISAVLKENPGLDTDDREAAAPLIQAKFAELMEEEMKSNLASYLTYNEISTYKYRENIIGIDTRLKKWIFGLQGEVNYIRANNYYKDDNKQSSALAYYALGTADVITTENYMLMPYFLFEQVNYFDFENNPGFQYSSGVVNSSVSGYRQLIFGLNIRFFLNYGFKTEIARTIIDPETDGLADIYKYSAQFYVAF